MSKFWWVNQGQSYKWESELRILWSPLATEGGKKQHHWDRMELLSPGDVVINYSEKKIRAVSEVLAPQRSATNPHLGLTDLEWQRDGREINLSMHLLDVPLELCDIPEELRRSWKSPGSPFNIHGGINQGYLFELSDDAGLWIMKELGLTAEPTDDLADAAPGTSDDQLELVIVVGPDGEFTTTRRPEHARLKGYLFGNTKLNACALCGNVLPNSLLVASHIKKRSECDLGERGDLRVVMAACALGCDAVYERGYIAVDQAGIIGIGPRSAETDHLRTYVNALVGKRVSSHTPHTAKYFAWHAQWHAQK
ncbi:hypothetical protein [Paeniglutamicibacter kerguelensis]|uniref:HNH endonuclease n=1 Tax=Paeniglutamicibacter kerguelensis TaxID=254788 RepID=A0ABS4XHM3_9MICC|nr:hypothetical protein [Paeniglutamicibacter kerguelensis]MBP2387972.1 hypothetical protein [Paeniglutamicibacter kerguelensis]